MLRFYILALIMCLSSCSSNNSGDISSQFIFSSSQQVSEFSNDISVFVSNIEIRDIDISQMVNIN